tara:strand:+ start:166 stop:1143 length:978 start_codon:yes stop_codon:yes gene_type:complete
VRSHRLRAAAGNSGATIFGDIKSLATSLGSATVPSPSNLQSIQSLIEAQNSAFNVFAVIGYQNCAEDLTINTVAGGKGTHTGLGINVNSSSSNPANIVSTGNTIVDMDGGSAEGLSVIDGKKWMAMAQFDGTNFDGILLWIFIGGSVGSVNESGTQHQGTSTANKGRQSLWSGTGLVKVRDIFYPAGDEGSDLLNIYPIAIDPSGTIYSNTTAGKVGWNFSNNSEADSTGYRSTHSPPEFSKDDGIFGFAIPTGTNSSYSEGDGGSYDPFDVDGAEGVNQSTHPAFGMGNQNAGDNSCNFVFWNGTKAGDNNLTNHVGFVFSGDA